ncbi:sporulation protein YqfC [Clostridium bornimense]|uniref:YabP/YqfC family sporulation protein n=1 Tax=Clostridium bornimense TaxID=1216932 RepID=UPI001C10D9E4|nr:YabP/YqfC family sporulation protein [Clostridium bornimense]MBU5315809.1 sporulation protein YqfC [Clostridium bornimense]
MNEKMRKSAEFLSEKLDIPMELVGVKAKITVLGDEEITVENHKGIISFSKEYLEIATYKENISLYGDNFEICYISEGTMVIRGKINKILVGEDHE